jgi:hypothetical protein
MRAVLAAALFACGCGNNASAPDGPGGGDDAPGDGVILPGDGPPAGDAIVVPACPSGQWCQEDPPAGVTGVLGAVYALDANNIFAVGDNGAILYRHQNAWAVLTSNTTESLRAVWGSSIADVYAGGANGALVHYNGSTWSVVTATSADINGIWGSASNDVWIVGPSLAMHWNGSAWSTPAQPVPGGVLNGVTGTISTDVWTTGESANVRHFTGGASWDAPVIPITGVHTYFAIASGASNVWVTSAGDAARLEGATWVEHGPGTATLKSLYIHAADDVWGVGGTKVGHWTGSAWDVSTPAQVTSTLYGVSGAGSDVVVVGAGAMILHRD